MRLNGIRIAPRKLRVLVNEIRDMDVNEVITLLELERAAARPLAKLIQSGVANVEQQCPGWSLDDLFIARATVDEGPDDASASSAPPRAARRGSTSAQAE